MIGSIKTNTGTVVAALPGLGKVFVRSDNGSYTTYMMCAVPSPDGRGVISAYPSPPEQSKVLFSLQGNVGFGARTGSIVGCINVTTPGKIPAQRRSYQCFNLGIQGPIAISKGSLELDSVLSAKAASVSKGDYSPYADNDTCTGDYCVYGSHGGPRMRLSADVAVFMGSPMAFTVMDDIFHRVRTFGATVESHSMLSEHVCHYLYEVHNVAYDSVEALGCLVANSSDAALHKGQDKALIGLPEDSLRMQGSRRQLPAFRLQTLSGGVFDGLEYSVVMPAPGVHKSTDRNTAPQPMAKVESNFNGSMLCASMNSLISVKSPFIEAISQVMYSDNPDTATEDLREIPGTEADSPWKRSEDALNSIIGSYNIISEDDKTGDAALLKLVDIITSGKYAMRFVQRLRECGFDITPPSLSSLEMLTERKQMKIGDNSGWSDGEDIPGNPYKFVPLTSKAAAIGSADRALYNRTSFISQEPDGSICLRDGYGSEIRMCRGNIYISPAMNLYLRPAKDISVMAGRHQSYNSQETCTINSSGDMYVNSYFKLHVSGVEGIDVDALPSFSRSFMEGYGGITVTSGGFIKTVSKLDTVFSIRDRDRKRYGKRESESSCGIYMDAGQYGSIGVYGNSCNALFHTSATVAVSARKSETPSSVIQVSGSGLLLDANTTVSGNVNVMPSGIRYTVPSPNSTTPDTLAKMSLLETPQVNASKFSVAISGHVTVTESASVFGNVIAAKQFAAGEYIWFHVGGTKRSISGITAESYKETSDSIAAAKGKIAEAGAIRRVQYGLPLSVYAWDDSSTYGCFSFPRIYNGLNSGENMVIRQMCWQQDNYRSSLRSSTFPKRTWSERTYTVMANADSSATVTMCYPGFHVWDTAKVNLYREDLTKDSLDFKTNYIL